MSSSRKNLFKGEIFKITAFLGLNDVIRKIYVIFKFRNCINGLATDYLIRYLCIARFKCCFKSVKLSKRAHLGGGIVKITACCANMTSYVKCTSYLNFENCFNGSATEHSIGFLFIARSKGGFKSAKFSKKVRLRAKLSKLRHFGPR